MISKKKSLLFTLSCIFLWAFIPVVSRFGQQEIDNYQFLFWSNLLSLITLSIASFIRKKSLNINKIYTAKDILISFFLGFLGTFLYYILLYYSYAHVNGLEVLSIQYTWPIFIVIFSYIILKEKIVLRNIISVFLGFIGVLIVLTKGNISDLYFTDWTTNLIVLSAAGVFGLFSVLSKKHNYEPFSATILFFLSGTLFSFISMLLFSSFSLPTSSSIIPILSNGIFINGFSYVLWLQALKYGKASFVAPFVFLTPIIGSLLVIMFFNEPLLLSYMIGLLLIVIAGVTSR